MLLAFNKVSFSYGADEILRSASFIVRPDSRVALIGRNGSGKTTIVNLIKGLISPAEGDIFKKRDIKLGFVDQRIEERFENLSLIDYIKFGFAALYEIERKIGELEREISKIKSGYEKSASYNSIMQHYSELSARFESGGGYTLSSRIDSMLYGMGFTASEFGRPLKQFSGGMQTRAQLCGLLLQKFDLIVLDEPTNYLDTPSLDFLESALKNSGSSALIISHDRYFLDNVAEKILYLYNHKTEEFPGNYSDFSEIFELRQNERINEYERQQEFIKKTEEFYRKYKAGIKSKMARGRKKFIDRLERLTDPAIHSRNMAVDFSKNMLIESGRTAISANNLKKNFGDKVLFTNASFEIERGSITGIIGANGAGKTTLLKMIMGSDGDYEGEIIKGHNVIYGYQDQLLGGLDASNRVIDEIWNIKKLMNEGDVRKYLAGFLFYGEDVFKPVRALSGGEKSRLIMAKIITGGANTLILDEPTNHLDIESKEALEQALLNFDGTVVFVSHDRYFIDKIADGLLVLENGGVFRYNGNYSYYREKSAETNAEKSKIISGGYSIDKAHGAANYENNTAQEINGGIKKSGLSKNAERILKNEIEKIETLIGEKEEETAALEKIFAANEYKGRTLSYEDTETFNRRYSELKNEIEALYEKWHITSSKLDN